MQRACNLPRDHDTRGQGVEGGRGQRDRRPETLQPGKRGRGGCERTSGQGTGKGQGAGAERGGGEGGLPRKLLRTVVALAGGQWVRDGSEGNGRAAGGTVKPWPGGSRGLPGPRPPRHLQWLPAAGAVAAAGSRSVVPIRQTTPTVEARCVPTTCMQLAYTVPCIVSDREKGRGRRGRQGGRRGKKAAGGCSATCMQLAQRAGHQGAERRRGGGRDASHIALQSARWRGTGRTRSGRREAKDLEAREEGLGRTREDEHTRGRAGQGSGSRGGLLRKLLGTVLVLAGGQRHGGGDRRTEAC